MTYADKKTCPFLILHGDKDNLVPLKQSRMLYEKLKAAGTDVKIHVVEGAGHGFISAEVDNMVDTFFEKHIKNLKTENKK